MKLKILVGLFTILSSGLVSADSDMMGSGMMSGMYGLGMGFLGLVYFAVFAFIFSLIFWYTYKLIVKKR
jgi:hypothetical protein